MERYWTGGLMEWRKPCTTGGPPDRMTAGLDDRRAYDSTSKKMHGGQFDLPPCTSLRLTRNLMRIPVHGGYHFQPPCTDVDVMTVWMVQTRDRHSFSTTVYQLIMERYWTGGLMEWRKPCTTGGPPDWMTAGLKRTELYDCQTG